MKKLFNCFSSFILFAVIAVSCQSNELDNVVAEKTANYDQMITFTYKGETYTSKAYPNGTFYAYEDESVQKISDEIFAKNPNLAVYNNPDGTLEIYDSIEEFEQIYKIKEKYANTKPSTKAPFVAYASIWLYTGENFDGYYVNKYPNKTNDYYVNSIEIPDLKLQEDFNFDQDISSFQVIIVHDSQREAKLDDICMLYMYPEQNFRGFASIWTYSQLSANYNPSVSDKSIYSQSFKNTYHNNFYRSMKFFTPK